MQGNVTVPFCSNPRSIVTLKAPCHSPRHPKGWEIGYNHFVGRLGMKLPETARLLARSWPDTYSFSWGLGTLTHADSASQLWRSGLKASALCKKSAAG